MFGRERLILDLEEVVEGSWHPLLVEARGLPRVAHWDPSPSRPGVRNVWISSGVGGLAKCADEL